MLREAYCLVRDGVADVDDIDRVVREGLGRRWAVIGPFETADLNTRGGIAEHARRLGPAYARMGAERGQDDPWTPELVEHVTAERRRLLPLDQWEERVAWRDRQLADESAEMSVHGRRWHGPPLTSRAVSELDEEVVPGRPREFIQSLQRGLEIIRAFGPHAPVQTVSELATTTGLTRATARRFLITLIELGYVETDGRTFRLTPRVLELGYSFLSGLGFPDVALPHLERLVAQVDESSEASVLDGEDIVYVVRVPSTAVMTLAVNVGGRMPAHATSMGKVLLASLPDTELEAYLSRAALKRYLPRTVTDRDLLHEQLMKVRAAGYAIVDQELEEGLVAIAAPVRSRGGRVAGAINLSTHIARRSADQVRADLVGPLLQTAKAIEADLAGVA